KPRDQGGNLGPWTRLAGANALNSAPAQDLLPPAPNGLFAQSLSAGGATLAWSSPTVAGYNDLAFFRLYRSGAVFSATTDPGVTQVTPDAAYPASSLSYTGQG